MIHGPRVSAWHLQNTNQPLNGDPVVKNLSVVSLDALEISIEG
jgi:hypothetical protein